MNKILWMSLTISLMLMIAAAGWTEEITLWHSWGAGSGHAKTLEQVAQLFEEEYGVAVNVVPSVQAERYLVAIAGGTPPDVAVLGGQDLKWIADGLIQPLTDYLQRDGLGPDDFFPGVWEAMEYEGELWTVPVQLALTTWQLLINEGMFELDGLDPNEYPRIVFELENMDQKFTIQDADGRITRVGIYPFDSWGAANAYIQWMGSWGGEFYDYVADDFTIASTTNISMLTWLRDWYARIGDAAYTQSVLRWKFQNSARQIAEEIVAMSLWLPGWFGSIDDIAGENHQLKLRSVWLPSHPDVDLTKSMKLESGWTFSIPTGALNPESAWEFIKMWATSPEAGLLLGENTNHIAIGRNNPFVQVLMQDPRKFATLMEYIQYAGPPNPAVPGFHGGTVKQLLNEVLPEVYQGERSPVSALEYIEHQMRLDMQDYR